MDTKEILASLPAGAINVNGDLVIEKHVEYEVNNVEKGGQGIVINNYAANKAPVSKAHSNDCSFKFEVEDKQEFNIAIQQFTNILKEAKLVPDDMDYLKMTRLFSGESCKTRYIWKGTKTFLHHLINKLCDGDNPIITTYPEGVTRWVVVSCRFYDEKGNSLGDISHCNSEQNNDKEMLIDKLYKAFADSL